MRVGPLACPGGCCTHSLCPALPCHGIWRARSLACFAGGGSNVVDFLPLPSPLRRSTHDAPPTDTPHRTPPQKMSGVARVKATLYLNAPEEVMLDRLLERGE